MFHCDIGALVKLSCRTGAPIRDENGTIIGTIVTGYSFEDSTFLEELKEFHNTELTIFEGGTRISSTIKQDGKQIKGTKIDEKIEKIVLQEGGTYTGVADVLGSSYITKYEPLFDSENKIVGATFVGISKEGITKVTNKTILETGIISLLIIVCCSAVVLKFTNKSIKQPMLKLINTSNMITMGKLDVQIDNSNNIKKDEIGMLSEAINNMILLLKSYITDINQILYTMSNNDFTKESSVEYIGDFITIGESFSSITKSLNQRLLIINTSAEQVYVGADQVSSGAQALASGSTEQAATVEELSSSIVEISKQADENCQQVQITTKQLEEAGVHLNKGNLHMCQLSEAMNEINDASNQISDITKVIEDISFQTNILALNAAIEAARTGVAGAGFAVVADEVRNLAAKSAEASKQTSELLISYTSKVHHGMVLAKETAEILEGVSVEAKKVIDSISKIEESSGQQAYAIEQIREGLGQVSGVVQTNAATAEQNSASSEQMSAQATMLCQEVGKFKLKTDLL